jgi:uncharacterized SAM-binding protein YcdF (DUF218 family)
MISSIVKFLLDPFHILLFLGLSTWIVWCLKREKWAKYLLAITACWFLISSTPFVPVLLLGSLENRYLPVNTEELTDSGEGYHIVVLGAGYTYDERFPSTMQLNQTTLARLAEGVRIHKKVPNSILVTSGPYNKSQVSQADVAKNAVMLLGVSENSVLTQSEPSNTFEEAKVYVETHHSGQNVILVTSAAHMHRAVMVFKNFGIEPIPSPTNYRLIGDRAQTWIGLPSIRNMQLLHTALNEYAAISREKVRSKS